MKRPNEFENIEKYQNANVKILNSMNNLLYITVHYVNDYTIVSDGCIVDSIIDSIDVTKTNNM